MANVLSKSNPSLKENLFRSESAKVLRVKRDRAGPLSILECQGFQVEFLAHARAILEVDFPEALGELAIILNELKIPIEEIVQSGGGETKATQRLRRALSAKNWTKTRFEIKKTINGKERESISHEVDHVRDYPGAGKVALEIEWNNKDPFFDRDLENFKRLHAEGAISAGIIITRGALLQEKLKELIARFVEERKIRGYKDLEGFRISTTPRQREAVLARTQRQRTPENFQQAWPRVLVNDKFGAATTHWRKLEDRVRRGVGNPCPLLLIGLPPSIVTYAPTGTTSQ